MLPTLTLALTLNLALALMLWLTSLKLMVLLTVALVGNRLLLAPRVRTTCAPCQRR